MADQALLRGTGARGLRAILEEVLLNVMYDLPEPHRRRARSSSTRDVVLEKVNPTLVPAQRDPAPAAPAAPRPEAPAVAPRMDLPAALAYLDEHVNLEASSPAATRTPTLERMRAAHATSWATLSARLAGHPHHRHQRQGLHRPDRSPACWWRRA